PVRSGSLNTVMRSWSAGPSRYSGTSTAWAGAGAGVAQAPSAPAPAPNTMSRRTVRRLCQNGDVMNASVLALSLSYPDCEAKTGPARAQAGATLFPKIAVNGAHQSA